jgi:hypothetical protein
MGGITVQNVNLKVTVLIERLFIGLKIFFSQQETGETEVKY